MNDDREPSQSESIEGEACTGLEVLGGCMAMVSGTVRTGPGLYHSSA